LLKENEKELVRKWKTWIKPILFFVGSWHLESIKEAYNLGTSW
jgi:hypothetical protein